MWDPNISQPYRPPRPVKGMDLLFYFIDHPHYHSVENLLSSRFLSKNLNIRIYKTIILPVVLYGCETWSLTLREEHRLGVFENKVLKRIFGEYLEEDGENCIMKSFMI
jgi:hypothetical protein